MTDRRAEPRLLDIELVMISWEQDGGKLMQLGNVKDVSLHGMGVLVDRALPVGTAVRVSYGEGQLTGVVKHESQTIEGPFMGIEFIGNSSVSALHFQPELLIRSL